MIVYRVKVWTDTGFITSGPLETLERAREVLANWTRHLGVSGGCIETCLTSGWVVMEEV